MSQDGSSAKEGLKLERFLESIKGKFYLKNIKMDEGRKERTISRKVRVTMYGSFLIDETSEEPINCTFWFDCEPDEYEQFKEKLGIDDFAGALKFALYESEIDPDVKASLKNPSTITAFFK